VRPATTKRAGAEGTRWAAYDAWLARQLASVKAGEHWRWLVRRLETPASPVATALRSRWLPVLVLAAASGVLKVEDGAAAPLLPTLCDLVPVGDALDALMLALSEAEEHLAEAAADACKQALSRLLLRPGGVRAVVPVLLANAAAAGSALPTAVGMVARLVASVPSACTDAATYYAAIGPQIVELLLTPGAPPVAAQTVRLALRQYATEAQQHLMSPLLALLRPPVAPADGSGTATVEAAAVEALAAVVGPSRAPAAVSADALEPGRPALAPCAISDRTDEVFTAIVRMSPFPRSISALPVLVRLAVGSTPPGGWPGGRSTEAAVRVLHRYIRMRIDGGVALADVVAVLEAAVVAWPEDAADASDARAEVQALRRAALEALAADALATPGPAAPAAVPTKPTKPKMAPPPPVSTVAAMAADLRSEDPLTVAEALVRLFEAVVAQLHALRAGRSSTLPPLLQHDGAVALWPLLMACLAAGAPAYVQVQHRAGSYADFCSLKPQRHLIFVALLTLGNHMSWPPRC